MQSNPAGEYSPRGTKEENQMNYSTQRGSLNENQSTDESKSNGAIISAAPEHSENLDYVNGTGQSMLHSIATPDGKMPDASELTTQNDAVKPGASAADPFDPMNLGISTDYAAAINTQASTKPIELRKPNEQEFFRTSPHKHPRLIVGGIIDKQDMSKLYVVLPSLLDEVRVRFPKHLRIHELVLTQTQAGAVMLWGVPQGEDRGGSWNSTKRDACHKGESRWTNMSSGRGQYDVTTIDNPREVDWASFPPMSEILRQALSEGRLIDSMDHPLLKKLRGEIE